MEIGFAVPTSGSWAEPEACRTLAVRAEELGYVSLWTFQRLLCPLDELGHPVLDPQYQSVHDPLAVLAYLAAVTETPRLGVAVVNAPYYSPILLAKMLTTIDRFSSGRLDVGIGLGWMEEEFEASGVSFERRGARTEEFFDCLRTIWTEPVVEYHGEHYEVPRSRVDPKPRQVPHPPVLFGGMAEASLRRAGRLGAGWVSSSRADLTSLGDSIAVVREAAIAAGRDPDGLRFVCRAVVKVRGKERSPLVGSLDQIRDDLGRLADAGVTEAFLDLNFDPEIGAPDADPHRSVARATEVLEALAPQPAGPAAPASAARPSAESGTGER